MSDLLASFHFVRPYWLLLALPAVVLWALQRRRSDAGERWTGVIDPVLLRHLLVGGDTVRKGTPNALLLATWLIGAVAVAGPTWSLEPSPFADARPPVVVALKVTSSMQEADLAPTRLDRARQKLVDLIALREGAATGLVAYSGSSHLVLPPTADGQVAITMAQALSPEVMPAEGDDFAAAVALARKTLLDARRGGSVLVMTDGVAPDQLAKIPARDGASVPATIFAMLSPEAAQAAGSLRKAASDFGAVLIETTVDQSDIAELAHRLDRAQRPADVADQGSRWMEAGYWLTSPLALLALGWFRRGWMPS